MSSHYILAPEAAQDLVDIWRYIQEQSSVAVADRVEYTIRERIISFVATRVLDTGEQI